MSIRGEIQTMPMSDLFQWVTLKHKTGTLALVQGRVVQKFYFNQGAIVAILSTAQPAINSAVEAQRVLAATLRWTEGRFEFTEDPIPKEVTTANLPLDIQQLLLDTAQESDPAEQAPPGGAKISGHQPGHPAPPLAEGLRLAIFDRLLTGEFKVPLIPAVVSKVLEMTQRENYSLRDLSEVILTDAVIAAGVLKQANSAYYASERYIDSLPMAVQRLGSETVTNMVFALSLQSLSTRHDQFVELKKRLWEHSSACALLARVIAFTVRLDHNIAFLCGLMMDFGKIVMLSLIQEVMTKESHFQMTPIEAVEGILEAYHPKAGGVVAEKWHLPAAVLETMTCHHSLSAASTHPAYVAIASLSDTLITLLKPARGPQVESQPAAPAAEELVKLPAAELLGLYATQMEVILEQAPECLQFAQEFLVK